MQWLLGNINKKHWLQGHFLEKTETNHCGQKIKALRHQPKQLSLSTRIVPAKQKMYGAQLSLIYWKF